MKITDSWFPRSAPEPVAQPKTVADGEDGGFGAKLKETLQQVNQLQNQAEAAMVEGAIRGPQNIHETMIKLNEAELSLKLLIKTRDKALEAYQEIMRMQF
ncbi:flagellar hook-basal body complex protein FliE [Desulfacinum hydrothermale DSM 13146]|uniref:Flagellar hook-basal body complex protein FliE n=1 Tax=Desulfacinum hydrothermale DSM 13146 TaxID=1121390 RepID=A0A1W1X6V9_9BACT|nr:flagellar hook-basal body complex protein FliE [Desulfacinum hydrothermale]SMC19221.1 flagellar hook-basal body complex protein FliE [Desulfacinum hydrothermale DSM 13146]